MLPPRNSAAYGTGPGLASRNGWHGGIICPVYRCSRPRGLVSRRALSRPAPGRRLARRRRPRGFARREALCRVRRIILRPRRNLNCGRIAARALRLHTLFVVCELPKLDAEALAAPTRDLASNNVPEPVALLICDVIYSQAPGIG